MVAVSRALVHEGSARGHLAAAHGHLALQRARVAVDKGGAAGWAALAHTAERAQSGLKYAGDAFLEAFPRGHSAKGPASPAVRAPSTVLCCACSARVPAAGRCTHDLNVVTEFLADVDNGRVSVSCLRCCGQGGDPGTCFALRAA